jgi:hypothetical protein
MDTNNESSLLKFREEYEQSGMTKAEFARTKGMEYWKANYALRKALRLKSSDSPPKIKFRKVTTKPIVTKGQEIRIRTSYGAEIIIPI